MSALSGGCRGAVLAHLAPLFLLAGLACWSCAGRPASPPATDAGEYLGEIPRDPEDLRALIESYRDAGQLSLADALARKGLDAGFPSEVERELREIRAELRSAQLLAAAPLRLEVWSERQVYALGAAASVELRIHNLGEESVTIPARSGWSWLPFTESRESTLVVSLLVTDVGTRAGALTTTSTSEFVPFSGSRSIEPGACDAHAIELLPAPSDGLLYRRVEATAELVAGGLERGGTDFGMVRLPFDRRTLHFFPAEVPGPQPPASLADLAEAVSAADAVPLFRAAVLLREEDRWAGVDLLVGALPTLAGRPRNLALAALAVLSGRNLGLAHDRWINWWAAERPAHLPEASDRGGEPRSPGIGGRVPPLIPLGLGLPADGGAGRRAAAEAPQTRPPDGASAAADWDELKRDLADPFYGRRDAAVRRIAGQPERALPFAAACLEDDSAVVRRGGAAVLAEVGGAAAAERLAVALGSEKDRGVRQALAQALALLEAPLAEPSSEAAAQERGLLQQLYLDTRIMKAMEGVMHEGSVPGFYDGQFARFWEIRPCAKARLMQMALDGDVHYIVRVLAIMSLSEAKPEGMEELLAALILPAKSELSREWYAFHDLRTAAAVTDDMIEESRILKLSSYARFALAKAGRGRYVLAKIAELEKWIGENTPIGEDAEGADELLGGRLRLRREFSRSLFFDIGYEYQQLDDYENAEEWYKVLLARFPDSIEVANAHYNLACLYSVQNRADQALHHLGLAMETGFLDFRWMDEDGDLDNIRHLPAFSELREKALQERPAEDSGGAVRSAQEHSE